MGKKKTVFTTKDVVVLDKHVAAKWDNTKTLKQNYVAMGLSCDPNTKQPEATNPVEFPEFEPPAPREEYLTLAEVINCRTMIMKHGSDYLAMWRDIKLNKYQHTRSKLKKMCTVYLEEYAHRDPLYVPKE